jgi:hypothetical protein
MTRQLRFCRISSHLGTFLLLAASLGCGGGKDAIEARKLVSLAVRPPAVTATVGDQVPLTVTATFNQPPTTQTNFAAQWSTSDEAVATIDPNTGTATCVAIGGPIQITASASDRTGTVRGVAALTCQSSPPPPPPHTGQCLVNGDKYTGGCRINSCFSVSDHQHCPLGGTARGPKAVVNLCIPGPPIIITVDAASSCTD